MASTASFSATHARLQSLLPGEGEQLPDQRRAAPRGVLDLRADRPPAPPEAGRAHRPGPAQDGGQQVVEIMRDAAGEAPDGFQPARLRQPASARRA